MAATAKKKSTKKQGMSKQTQMTIAALAGAVVLIVGGWWTYMKLTTVPPPDLAEASTEEVADYLGEQRGFARQSIAGREAFLAETFQKYSSYDDRLSLCRSLDRLSQREKQVLVDATYEVFHTRVMEIADQFNRQTTKKKKKEFVDKAIGNFRKMQANLGGGGDANLNVGQPFKSFLPQRKEEWQKMLITKTTPSDRAKALPLLEAFAEREKSAGR